MSPKHFDRIFWLMVGTAIAVLLIAGKTLAQESTQLVTVPPLPNADLPPSAPSSGWAAPLPPPAGAEWSSSSPTGLPEAVYQAPSAAPLPPSLSPSAVAAPPQSSYPFIVYVNGDSPFLLEQVRAVVPSASIQVYQGRQVIQTGTFPDELGAKQQVMALRTQGIGADVIQGGVNAASPVAANSVSSVGVAGNQFLVVIPARPTEYYGLGEQLLKMGFPAENIIPKDQPLGFHLQVGAFADHNTANALAQRLRANGLDARVYYQR